MTPALAAAGKNIKNAVASMIRIFSVGPDFLTKEQTGILVKDVTFDRFKTIMTLPSDLKIDLI